MTTPQFTPEQLAEIESAQQKAFELKANMKPISDNTLDLLLRQARSHNGWQKKPVDSALLRELYDIVKMGSTSMNTCPARFVFLQTDEAKQRLKPALAEGNIEKVVSAPVVAIIAHDLDFHQQMPKLFPHNPGAADLFSNNQQLASSTAFRNGTLQGAYFMIAARALGLDCGPMSGFNNQAVDEEFFAGSNIKSNFLCGLGYGDTSKLFQRLPRFDFDEVCELL